jgi:hypothetical protein
MISRSKKHERNEWNVTQIVIDLLVGIFAIGVYTFWIFILELYVYEPVPPLEYTGVLLVLYAILQTLDY